MQSLARFDPKYLEIALFNVRFGIKSVWWNGMLVIGEVFLPDMIHEEIDSRS